MVVRTINIVLDQSDYETVKSAKEDQDMTWEEFIVAAAEAIAEQEN